MSCKKTENSTAEVSSPSEGWDDALAGCFWEVGGGWGSFALGRKKECKEVFLQNVSPVR